MKKTIVKDYAGEGKPIYSHLDIIVDWLLLHGMTQTSPERWMNTPGGWICTLKGNVNFDVLSEVFDFPESIHLDRKNTTIVCLASYSDIICRR